MRTVLTIDETLCVGCGLCSNACPEIFELGHNDEVARVKSSGGDTTNIKLKGVIEDCPVSAIQIKEKP